MSQIGSKVIKRWNQFRVHPVAGKKMNKACLRYLSFHLTKSWKKNKEYQWIGNLKFHARPGDAGINPNIFLGLYEFSESCFLMHFLRPTDTFIDIGANLGHYSLLATGITRCQTIAIEPIPQTFNQLKSQVSLNSLSKYIQLINAGVSFEEGKLYFSANKDTMNHCVEKDYPGAIQIPVTTLDTISENTVPRAIKIDVEGYEKFVLQGGMNTLAHHNLKVIIIEINGSGRRYGIQDKEIYQLLLSFGFQPFRYLPEGRKLERLEDFNKDQFNTIFLRDIPMVKERIKTAETIKIWNQKY